MAVSGRADANLTMKTLSKGGEVENGAEPRLTLPPLADTVVTEREIKSAFALLVDDARHLIVQDPQKLDVLK